jgi:hypothetical protein
MWDGYPPREQDHGEDFLDKLWPGRDAVHNNETVLDYALALLRLLGNVLWLPFGLLDAVFTVRWFR